MVATELTREEILAMPAGREMDLLIARKVLDMLVIRYTGPGTGPYGGDHASTIADVEYWQVGQTNKRRAEYERSLPPFSTDIAAAWQVVEKFDYFCLEHRSRDERWRVHGGYVSAYAETASLAICRAALLAALVRREVAT